MKKVLLLLLTTPLAGVLLFTGPSVTTVDASRGGGFSNRNLRGPYAFAFDGVATIPLPDGTALAAPLSAVGTFRADGHGNFPIAERVLNFGGLAVLTQTASGEYAVSPSGLGTAWFRVETVGCEGACTPEQLPPGVSPPPPVTVETFSFVLHKTRQGKFMATGLFAEDGTPLFPISALGDIRRQ